MMACHWTLRDWLGALALGIPLALLAWQAGAWLWRLTGRLFPQTPGTPLPPSAVPPKTPDHRKD